MALTIPEPDSPAWLEALDRSDAMLAEHVRGILAHAGRANVCSICGDDHPADFRLPDTAANRALHERLLKAHREKEEISFTFDKDLNILTIANGSS
jgi:hypothetical protein